MTHSPLHKIKIPEAENRSEELGRTPETKKKRESYNQITKLRDKNLPIEAVASAKTPRHGENHFTTPQHQYDKELDDEIGPCISWQAQIVALT